MGYLVEETLETLKEHGVSVDDIEWVGSKDGLYAMPWGDFEKQFKDLIYDCGYGGQEIAKDLIVVGTDWWLERHEYDGAEWWEFKKLPEKKNDAKPFDKVTGDMSWETLDYFNNGSEDDRA